MKTKKETQPFILWYSNNKIFFKYISRFWILKIIIIVINLFFIISGVLFRIPAESRLDQLSDTITIVNALFYTNKCLHF